MRKKIEKRIEIHLKSVPYKNGLTWKCLMDVKDKLQDDDIISEFVWRDHKIAPNPFGMSDGYESDEYEQRLYAIILRNVLETDEEYVERLKREETEKREIEKRDYETYLKLKGRFEKS